MTSTFNDKAAFIRQIAQNQDVDAARLVYADWLEERGESDKAEFIRVQCELGRLTSDVPLLFEDRLYTHGRYVPGSTIIANLMLSGMSLAALSHVANLSIEQAYPDGPVNGRWVSPVNVVLLADIAVKPNPVRVRIMEIDQIQTAGAATATVLVLTDPISEVNANIIALRKRESELYPPMTYRLDRKECTIDERWILTTRTEDQAQRLIHDTLAMAGFDDRQVRFCKDKANHVRHYWQETHVGVCVWDRGFIKSIRLSSSECIKYLDQILAEEPVRTVNVTGAFTLQAHYGYESLSMVGMDGYVYKTSAVCEALGRNTDEWPRDLVEGFCRLRWPSVSEWTMPGANAIRGEVRRDQELTLRDNLFGAPSPPRLRLHASTEEVRRLFARGGDPSELAIYGALLSDANIQQAIDAAYAQIAQFVEPRHLLNDATIELIHHHTIQLAYENLMTQRDPNYPRRRRHEQLIALHNAGLQLADRERNAHVIGRALANADEGELVRVRLFDTPEEAVV